MTHTVTLTGPGGIGKSRLALRAGAELGRHFSDGVWVLKVAALERAELLSDALAHSLGVSERRDVGIADALLDHLRECRMLLLLDNCDSLLDACEELVSWIVSRCDGVRVLCTSRQRLGVPGEAVVAVAPFRVPAATEHVSLTSVADAEALRLLVDRARAVAPGFELTDDNCAAAADICRRLDGLPLAIELAAVRLASLSADDLLERLDDRFLLLKAERGQQPPRHRALQTTVEWSHELLGEEARILWRRLSIFAGSFDIAAAEAVCSGHGLERERVLDLLGDLVERSILTMVPTGRKGRYRLLETIRLYGGERLREAGEEAELQLRHALWYAELVSAGEIPWWGTNAQAEVLDRLDSDWANVEAALEFFARSPVDAETGLRMAADLWLYWAFRGRYRLGRRHLEVLLARAETPTATRAMALWAFSFLAQATGEHDVALAGFEEAQRMSAHLGADRELGYALIGLGLVRLRLRALPAAVESLEAARKTMLRVEDAMGFALGTYFLATARDGAGQLTEACRLAQEALAASETAGEFAQSNVNTLLGIVQWRLGDREAAQAKLKEAVRTQNEIGHRWGMATSLEGLAWLAASSGQFERAAHLLGASASIWQELGNALLPVWQAYHHDCEAETRAGLGEARYQARWEEGFRIPRGAEAAAALEDTLPYEAPPRAASAEEEDLELTDRELEVARLVAAGLSNPAIAATLFVSRATVKTHVSHILRKLTLDSRVQLASWVAAHDLAATTAGPR